MGHLQAPFPPEALRWRFTGFLEEPQTDLGDTPVEILVRPELRYDAVVDRLNALLGLDWSSQTQPRPGNSDVTVLLHIRNASRSAFGRTFEEAFLAAAELFDIGRYLRAIPETVVEVPYNRRSWTQQHWPEEVRAELDAKAEPKRSPLEYVLAQVLDSPQAAQAVRDHLNIFRLYSAEHVRALGATLHALDLKDPK
jgi:hypothetical protein